MEFDYMDMKCPNCGHKELKYETCQVVYNLYTCQKCHSSFRVTTAMTPDLPPEGGHRVTMLPDTCANCGKQTITYAHSRRMAMDPDANEYMAWDYLQCSKCGALTQVGLFGDVMALNPRR
ncbi:MAG: hypothetical protein ACFFF4_13690 [Candidatus Thorarchaeota archaeon]